MDRRGGGIVALTLWTAWEVSVLEGVAWCDHSGEGQLLARPVGLKEVRGAAPDLGGEARVIVRNRKQWKPQLPSWQEVWECH